MNCFVTGANGFIGFRLVQQLTAEGHQVKCLVRGEDKFGALTRFTGTQPVIGDLDNIQSLEQGADRSDVVFHLAAYAKPWSKDKSLPYRINVTGAGNVFKASLRAGVRRCVFTSSGAVIGPSPGIEPIDESFPRTVPFFNDYEETKAEAERLALEYCTKGLETVIVNPTRVYGPGPVNESNATTMMISRYSRGRWRILPGNGRCVGNYVYIDDVIRGHIGAAMSGRAGERYILGGENLTFIQFFDTIARLTGRKHRLMPLPVPVMVAAATLMEWQAPVTGIPPPITAPWVRKYLNHWSLSSSKAEREIGYSVTPLLTGAGKTLDWLADKGMIR